MTDKKKIIPFSWFPAAWGLKGKTRQIAEAEYNYTGYELEVRLAEINWDSPCQELDKKLLDIEYEYEKITEKEYKYAKIKFIEGGQVERDLAELELNREYGVVTDTEYAKTLATLRNEPWVTIVTSVNKGDPAEGELELDWNDQFIELLDTHGYVAKDPNESVNLWLSTLCKNIAMEEFAGIGTFEEDLEAGAIIRKNKLNEGKWEAK